MQSAFPQSMYVEAQTKKLAQTGFLFVAAALCAIYLCMVATARHNVLAPRATDFPVYAYQNPFGFTDSATPSEIKAGGALAKLLSFNWFLGLSGLGAVWLASSWYLQGGLSKIKRTRRIIAQLPPDPPAKMNPLAVLPTPVTRVSKQNTVRSMVVPPTIAQRSLAHRKTTAPCQSRFRPVTLVSSRTRFGPSK